MVTEKLGKTGENWRGRGLKMEEMQKIRQQNIGFIIRNPLIPKLPVGAYDSKPRWKYLLVSK
jgi:hypothetical protein